MFWHLLQFPQSKVYSDSTHNTYYSSSSQKAKQHIIFIAFHLQEEDYADNQPSADGGCWGLRVRGQRDGKRHDDKVRGSGPDIKQ